MPSEIRRWKRFCGRAGNGRAARAILLLFALLFLSSLPAAKAGQPTQRASGLSVERLIARGDALMARRDIAAARLLYELAAAEGSARAAARLGATYDPARLKRDGVQGQFADRKLAETWYRRAVDGGYPEAEAALERFLGTEAEAAASLPEAPEPVPEIPALEAPAPGPPTVAVEPAAPAKGNFWVQLASLSTEALARRELARMKELHAGLIGETGLTLKRRYLGGGSKLMFGVQAGPFADLLTATALCDALKTRSQDCFVLR